MPYPIIIPTYAPPEQKKSAVEKLAKEATLQASIDVSRELEYIAGSHISPMPNLKNVRQNRKVEKLKEDHRE